MDHRNDDALLSAALGLGASLQLTLFSQFSEQGQDWWLHPVSSWSPGRGRDDRGGRSRYKAEIFLSVIQQISVTRESGWMLWQWPGRGPGEKAWRTQRFVPHQKGGSTPGLLRSGHIFAFLLGKCRWLGEAGSEGTVCACSWLSPTLGRQKFKQAR